MFKAFICPEADTESSSSCLHVSTAHKNYRSMAANTEKRVSETSDADYQLIGNKNEAKHREPDLSRRTVLAYSVGHVLNDLTASLWFSYLLTFYKEVIQLKQPYAGILLLLGQVVDGLATPLSGFLSDKLRFKHTLRSRAERSEQPLLEGDKSTIVNPFIGRKVWIGVSSVLVALSFPFIFHNAPTVLHSDISKALYYSIFIAVFQLNWAVTQVNHLALSPDLTNSSMERRTLNSFRGAWTIASNVIAYGLAWYLLQTDNNQRDLGPEDERAFFHLALILVILGSSFTIIFFINTSEPRVYPHNNLKQQHKWHTWLCCAAFWIIGIVYSFTRLIVNVSQALLPIFLIWTLKAPKFSIAIVPLCTFMMAFVGTLFSRQFTEKLSCRSQTGVGCAAVVGSSILFYYMKNFSLITYIAAMLLGLASGVISVSSLSLVGELVGINCDTAAFVYGSHSLLDKFANGLCIALIEAWAPNIDSYSGTVFYQNYYRSMLCIIPGASAIMVIALLPLITSNRLRKVSEMAL